MDIEAVDEAFFGDGGLMSILNDLAIDAEDTEVEAELAEWKGKFPGADSYDNLRYEEKSYWAVDGPNGTINLDELKDNINSFQYADAFTSLGFDMNTTSVKNFINNLEDSYAASPIGQADQIVSQAQSKGVILDKKLNGQIPTDEADFEKKITDANGDSSVAKKLNSDLKAAKEGIDPNNPTKDPTKWQQFKKWCGETFTVKNFLIADFVAILAYLSYDLVEFIKSIGHAMSGCWSYQNGTQSCKIAALTCDNSDLVNDPSGGLFGAAGKGFNFCQTCTDINCATGDWIPLQISQACPCDSKGANYLTGYDYTASTGINPCTGGTNSATCPIKEAFKFIEKFPSLMSGSRMATAGAVPAYACPNASGCVAKTEACASTMNSDCSSWCDPSIIMTKAGQTLRCVNCSFSCALAASVGNIVSSLFPSSLLNIIEKVLLWTAVGIVGLVVIFVLVKTGKFLFGGKKEKGGGNTANSPRTYPAPGAAQPIVVQVQTAPTGGK